MKSLDYKLYKELAKSYLSDVKDSFKNLRYKTILPLTLAGMISMYSCGDSSDR